MFEIICWVILTYTILSFLEYYVHKYHMHRPGILNILHPWLFTNHHKIHHPAYREHFDISVPEEHKDIGINTPIIKVTIPAFFVSLLLGLLISWTGAIVFFSGIVLHMLAWNVFHREMHKSKDSWLKSTRIYKFLARHHYMHHLYPKHNFNIICLLADYILSSKKYPNDEDMKKLKEYDL